MFTTKKDTLRIYENVNFCLRCGEKLTIKPDRENYDRPSCEKCGWIYYKNPIPASCMLILNSQNRILLVKRKYYPAVGKWALPSGYVEIFDSPEETAEKETLEETGLKLNVKEFLGYKVDFSPLYARVISFGFLMETTYQIPKAGDDAAEVKFEEIEKTDYVVFKSHRKFINILKRKLEGETND